MILSCQNISKSFGTDEILKNVSFHIEENEKAAVVGINGAGKSTLLKIIMKQENPDEGEVTLAKDKTIGYLAQYQDVSGHHTIYEEVLDSKRDIIEMEERLRDMETQMNTLSGEALEQLLDTYHKLSHEFEQVNGYAYRSEVTGILKGLGFTGVRQENERTLQRTENPCISWKTACDKAGHPAFRRADQPSGYRVNPMAGNFSDELQGSCFNRIA